MLTSVVLKQARVTSQNETTMAELEDSELNPTPEEGIYDSDSAEELLGSLLSEPGARFGQGEWVWTIVAQNADPDSVIPEHRTPTAVMITH